ncbi:MAG: tetratricopeptide repeat protein [Microcoleus sp. SU_5_3]|nr:tetratricopeptide repeat protein [Microcoleus sp. SU_5_3]
MDNSDLQKNHFTALKHKYKVGQYNSGVSDSFLYLILRKADQGIQVTNLEFQWLIENRLVGTVEIISLEQYQAEDKKRLEAEFWQLRTNYNIPKQLELPMSSPVYSILGKLDAGYSLTDSELNLLNNHGLVDTITLIQDILYFSQLKSNYKATNNLNHFPEEPLYSILKKLDVKAQLSDSDADWLLDNDFEETLEIHWQQEDERKAELEFSELKSKYQIDAHPDTSISSPLYSLLRKLDSELELEPSECEWLKQQNLSELIAIDRERKDRRFFAELKNKYKATQYQSSDPSSRLFLILRILEISESKTSNPSGESKVLIDSEKDIQWLSEQGLVETVDIAKQIHFKALKTKYQIVGQLTLDPFYEIMLKLEREERLDPKQVIQLIEEGRLARHGKIAVAYYRLEAIFCEKEHQRTGNKWNLPSASSNWRKADEPEKALKVTENVNWNKVQESDLKSALWVTRGAAFRDINQLDEAENCATQARECHPDSHQPYTLMGAICYDRGEYADGDNWFELAAERGADDTDDEIERIVRMTKDKDKRREVAEYLLSKDSNRYKWANSYIK